jgi:hypothetical protein
MRALGRARRKYHWSDALRAELMLAYGLKKFERARALDRLMAHTGWPRHALKEEALRMRLSRLQSHPAALAVPSNPPHGYDLMILRNIFGCQRRKIKSWLDRGLLGKPYRAGRQLRVTDGNLLRFIRKYPHEYDLARVDQVWFKAMVFGALSEVT